MARHGKDDLVKLNGMGNTYSDLAHTSHIYYLGDLLHPQTQEMQQMELWCDMHKIDDI